MKGTPTATSAFVIMKLYNDNGYLNIPEIINHPAPFIFIVGARGIGKTYGVLKYCLENEANTKFLYMRRDAGEMELVRNDDFSPFKVLNRDLNADISSKNINKYIVGFYHSIENENGKVVSTGEPIGYGVSLSSIAHVRGFGESEIKLMFYDEFIPEGHVHRIRDEGVAVKNAYETVNRNRELEGRPPLKFIAAANSNNLANPVFVEFGLVAVVEKMARKGRDFLYLPERGILVLNLSDSPISQAKQDTALYRASGEGTFANMALGNKYEQINDVSITHHNIIEFKSLVTIGELTIYKHKTKALYYVSLHKSGTPTEYQVTEVECLRFVKKYRYLWSAYMKNNIDFESSTCEVLFQRIFDVM